MPEIICTGAGKQKGDSCRKRFECQKFKNFMQQAENGKFKNVDMDKVYKKHYLFKPKPADKETCLNFEARAL